MNNVMITQYRAMLPQRLAQNLGEVRPSFQGLIHTNHSSPDTTLRQLNNVQDKILALINPCFKFNYNKALKHPFVIHHGMIMVEPVVIPASKSR